MFPIHTYRKFSCINVQNNEELLLIDGIMRLENYIELIFKKLNFPLPVNQIKLFATSNPGMNVNVYALDNENNIVGPYYFSQLEKSIRNKLVLLDNGEKLHYVLNIFKVNIKKEIYIDALKTFSNYFLYISWFQKTEIRHLSD